MATKKTTKPAQSAQKAPEADPVADTAEETTAEPQGAAVAVSGENPAMDWDDYTQLGRAFRHAVQYAKTHGETADAPIGEAVHQFIIQLRPVIAAEVAAIAAAGAESE